MRRLLAAALLLACEIEDLGHSARVAAQSPPLLTPAAGADRPGAGAAGGAAASWAPPRAAFNDFGLVSPFATAARRERPKQEDAPVHADATNLPARVPKTEWHQTENEVVLTVFIPRLAAAQVKVLLSLHTLALGARDQSGQKYELDLDLGNDILPGKSSWEVTVNAVAVTLTKRTVEHWGSLERPPAVARGGGVKPFASIPRQKVALNTSHKFDVIQVEAEEVGAGGWLVGRNAAVGKAMASLAGQCSTRAIDWWSYSVCHYVSVSQYHDSGKAEAAAPPATLLGTVDTSEGGVDAAGVFVAQLLPRDKALLAKQERGGASRLHSGEIVHEFGGGDRCEGSDGATGRPRSGTVAYVCGETPEGSGGVGGFLGAYIARVHEVRTCEYEITVHVPALCEFGARPHFISWPTPYSHLLSLRSLLIQALPVRRTVHSAEQVTS